MVRQSSNKKPSNKKHKNPLEQQDLDTEETTKIKHLMPWQSEKEKESYQTTNRDSLRETKKPMLDELDKSRPPDRMKVNQLENQGESWQLHKEMEPMKDLERDEKDREMLSEEENDERQREKERLENLLIQRMRLRETEHHDKMKKQKRQTERPKESKADMKTFGETDGQSDTLNQWMDTEREKAIWLEDQQGATERQPKGMERDSDGNGGRRTERELMKASKQCEVTGEDMPTNDLRKQQIREKTPNWTTNRCREERNARELEEIRKLLDEIEQGEANCKETDDQSLLKFKKKLRRLLRERERDIGQEAETEKQNLPGKSDADSQCQEEEKSQTVSQHEEDSSSDTQESDILSLTESSSYYEDEVHSKNDIQLPGRDKSVRRRVIGWVNDKMKDHYQRKICRTIQRENQEGDDLYVTGT